MVKKESSNPFVTIAGSLGGILVGIVAIIALFSSSNLNIVIYISWAFVALGLVTSYFAYKTQNKK